MHCMRTKLYNRSLEQVGFNEIYQLKVEGRLIQAINKAKRLKKKQNQTKPKTNKQTKNQQNKKPQKTITGSCIDLLENVVDPS